MNTIKSPMRAELDKIEFDVAQNKYTAAQLFTKLQTLFLFNAQPVPEVLGITLNGYQLKEALAFIAPDDDADQLEQEVTLMHGDGHSGKGLYCAYTEYPEEGAIKLDEEPTAQMDAPEPGASVTVQGGSMLDDTIALLRKNPQPAKPEGVLQRFWDRAMQGYRFVISSQRYG